MTMNETVDSVYRFVTDQSSSAYNKMNSFVASLRRRFDKVLTTAANNNNNNHSTNQTDSDDGETFLLEKLRIDARALLTMNKIDQQVLKNTLHVTETMFENSSPSTRRRLLIDFENFLSFSHSDEHYLPSVKVDGNSSTEKKNGNVYDTLNKLHPMVRSNPTIHHSSFSSSSSTTTTTTTKDEAGKPVHMQRHSLRSSMRHFIKRRSIKVQSKKILGTINDSQTSHIYESLDTPSPDSSSKNNPFSSSSNDQSYISAPLAPPIFKSSYVLPSAILVLDHFTTNLYLVVNAAINQLLVVFGSTKIHTIKLYDTNGRKMSANDVILQYKFEDLHGYKLLSSALNHTLQNRMLVNEIRVYVSQSTDDIHSSSLAANINSPMNQTLKQRLLFFDQYGQYVSASKRLPVNNELLFVEVDRFTAAIYAYDGLNLINIDENWSNTVENIDCISSGSNFLVCLHTKTNQISIYNSQTGSFIYRWLITSPNIRHIQSIYLCVSRQNFIYVLVWNCDVHPVNNLVLVFDQEGQLRREYYVPNRIIPNLHGTYTYDMTMGNNGNAAHHLTRRPSRKPDVHPLAWMHQSQQGLWNPNGRHPQLWPGNAGSAAPPFSPMHHGLSRAYELMYPSQQQQQQVQQQVQEDHTLFHPRFVAITDDDTLILSNIIDLGLDEETQETALVNVSRKVLFFHLDP